MKKILAFLMSLLGFTVVSCNQVEYGCPYAEFDMKGVVTDEENHPIENIQIAVSNHDYDTVYTYTDAAGKYYLPTKEIYPWDSVQVVATDIDGIEHGGEFESATQLISFSSSEFKGGDGNWYEGKASKEVNFQLKKKE